MSLSVLGLLMFAGVGIGLMSLFEDSAEDDTPPENPGTDGRDLVASPSLLENGDDAPYAAAQPFDTQTPLSESLVTAKLATKDSDGIDLGDGDDVVLLDGGHDDEIRGSIRLGAGNDTLIQIGRGDGTAGAIDAGDGDDVINITRNYISTTHGGEGNDHITVTNGNSDGPEIYGDGGDDTIVARNLASGRIYGGEGNDTITADQTNWGGTGAVVAVDAGPGDDHLIFEAALDQGAFIETGTVGLATAPSLTGGEGADTFEIKTVGEIEDFRMTHLHSVSSNEQHIGHIADFTPGEDHLVIEVTPPADGYNYIGTETRIGTDRFGTPFSRLFIRYEDNDNHTFNYTVGVSKTSLSADDYSVIPKAK